MNVYDFDRTIINDDSTKLFLLYCLKKMPRVFLCRSIRKLESIAGFIRNRKSVEAMKESVFEFLKYIPEPEKLVENFWNENMDRVEPYYQSIHRSDDLIISASPDFLVRPIADKLGVSLIATEMSVTSGKILGKNCKGKEKLRRFREVYPDALVESFYSDSLSDTPMAEIAKHPFLIVDHQPQPWPEDQLNVSFYFD